MHTLASRLRRRLADSVLGLELDKQEDRFLEEVCNLMERGNYEILTEVCPHDTALAEGVVVVDMRRCILAYDAYGMHL